MKILLPMYRSTESLVKKTTRRVYQIPGKTNKLLEPSRPLVVQVSSPLVAQCDSISQREMAPVSMPQALSIDKFMYN